MTDPKGVPENRHEARIAALMERVSAEAPELVDEVSWLADRYRRSERNLEKISKVSDGMQAQILELNDRLRSVSVTDALTGLTNRRGAQEQLLHQTELSQSENKPLCIILLDIDHFKKVNDTHGHDVGDEVLIEVAQRLRRSVRHGDFVARWGGEEFLAILPETDVVGSANVLDILHHSLRAEPVRTAAGPLTVTASSGLTHYKMGEVGFEPALSRADHGLYAAKFAGRDRWQISLD